jgi:hypothetical protein
MRPLRKSTIAKWKWTCEFILDRSTVIIIISCII